MIEVKGLTFRYDVRERPALTGVSLSVPPGQSILVVGPSGCGKSTLGLCVSGLIPHVIEGEMEGSVRVAGLETTTAPLPEIACRVGTVFQDPNAQLVMERVDDELAFGMENLGVPPGEMPARIDRALQRVGLEGYRSHRVRTLSGGLQQRLVIAAALVMEPHVMVLDEPTSNLDPAGTTSIFELLRHLQRQRQVSLLLIEHKLNDVADWIDRVAVMEPGGDLRAVGSPEELLVRVPRRGRTRGDRGGRGGRPAMQVHGLTIQPVGAARPILNQIELTVYRGELLALVGANGAGKSTLAQHLVGMRPSAPGTLFINGEEIGGLSSRQLAERVGYVFQNPEHQFVTDSVKGELAYGPRLLGEPEARVAGEVKALLRQSGLSALAEANPFSLSQGEKRRLSVAAMLIHRPQVLILDEPTFGQDPESTARLVRWLLQLHRGGTTLVIITHDMELVQQVSTRVAVLTQGCLLYEGDVAELFGDDRLLERSGLRKPAPYRVEIRRGSLAEGSAAPFEEPARR